ncbi:MAG: hypothetical protein R8G66_05260 [Cytophagales bacterium]|nr:hypothetical protein [Cytophagales bacterium]
MGVNTIILINQQSVNRKGVSYQFGSKKQKMKLSRVIIDQLIWWTALILLMDMALKNKRKRLTAWWADR